jgi:hypothetical protein
VRNVDRDRWNVSCNLVVDLTGEWKPRLERKRREMDDLDRLALAAARKRTQASAASTRDDGDVSVSATQEQLLAVIEERASYAFMARRNPSPSCDCA